LAAGRHYVVSFLCVLMMGVVDTSDHRGCDFRVDGSIERGSSHLWTLRSGWFIVMRQEVAELSFTADQDPAVFSSDWISIYRESFSCCYSLGPLLKNFELSLMIQMLLHQVHKTKRVSPAESLYTHVIALCAWLSGIHHRAL
jgi:hypothetical protein